MGRTLIELKASIVGVSTFFVGWAIWTWVAFDLFLTVAHELGYNLYAVSHEVYWLMFVIIWLWAIRATSSSYNKMTYQKLYELVKKHG